ncbi:Pre-rRNA-processing protein TSR2 [Fulvia fulva]|uniref:Pre-rRNA-processing protein TSR2 n=1 Tax=Passalora fulva TaxID=5499 RepID=A0A9Q8PC72_PASFU|nr:Pre-rRNA-processing protein TSR2 [Fulvia fulva]KAK4619434.1 Pre-rRNA-processing protein TSR2 [Fulvia fulva]KAK4620778.1 Pre-rRNA-processing protein TSR2 [Fulvia fulva]UJO19788.1 Pre-rRNA-processing protein TSR2 [Fulvia fulva]WPV17215.1 Pre-rRNA-processing protein TSR2 [Fulvia fulva]WPV31911.1 Pre-rRNA-processing protein TSR2 [Fulvia fulva]
MATAPAPSGPQPTGGLALPPTPEQLQSAFDNSIWYLLSLWPILHDAVSNGWGGPESTDKRDWFAGAISDLLNSRKEPDGPGTDQEDMEVFLLQIMQDEFDCFVEDESEVKVAGEILLVWKRMREERSLDAAREVEHRYRNRGQMRSSIKVQEVNQDLGEDEEWDGFEDEEGDDAEMGEPEEAPRLVPATVRERVEPVVDDDGFMKVAGKRKGR